MILLRSTQISSCVILFFESHSRYKLKLFFLSQKSRFAIACILSIQIQFGKMFKTTAKSPSRDALFRISSMTDSGRLYVAYTTSFHILNTRMPQHLDCVVDGKATDDRLYTNPCRLEGFEIISSPNNRLGQLKGFALAWETTCRCSCAPIVLLFCSVCSPHHS